MLSLTRDSNQNYDRDSYDINRAVKDLSQSYDTDKAARDLASQRGRG